MKIYVVTSGFQDDKIELITNNLKEAFDYVDSKKYLCDLKEYEFDTYVWRRPKRKELKKTY